MKKTSLTGQSVVYYEPYTRDIVSSAKQGKITKVGSKYIHVGTLKFDIDTMSSDLPHYRLYLGTLAEFTEAVTWRKDISHLLAEIQKEVDIEQPLSLLREIGRQLTSIKALIDAEDGQ